MSGMDNWSLPSCNGDAYVFILVGLFVGWFVFRSVSNITDKHAQTNGWISLKFSGKVRHGTGTSLEHFAGAMFNHFDTGFFLLFGGNSFLLAKLPRMGKRNFMKLSGEIYYSTRHNFENFHVTLSVQDCFVFVFLLFSGSVFLAIS